VSQVPNAIKLKDKVVKGGGRVVIRPDSGNPEKVLVPVYKDGKVLKTYTFKEIRANSEA